MDREHTVDVLGREYTLRAQFEEMTKMAISILSMGSGVCTLGVDLCPASTDPSASRPSSGRQA